MIRMIRRKIYNKGKLGFIGETFIRFETYKVSLFLFILFYDYFDLEFIEKLSTIEMKIQFHIIDFRLSLGRLRFINLLF